MGSDLTAEELTRKTGPTAIETDQEQDWTVEVESVKTDLTGWGRQLVVILSLILGLFHLYTAGFGLLPNLQQRSIHLGLGLALAFALYPMRGRKRGTRIPIWDLLLMLLALSVAVYVVVDYPRIITGITQSTLVDRLMSVAVVLMAIEASRRTIGLVFPILISTVLAYAYFGGHLTGLLAHRGFSFVHLAEQLFMTSSGVWGPITGISATLVAIFVMLGTVLLHCGGGRTFIDLAIWVGGRLVGGAAKAAVVASSMIATINGNGPANVATTGTLTIPMMIRLGYRRELAGAVEAAASSGGQIAPPIMGAGAFVMAELLGIPYGQIALAAVVPAFMYYLGVWYTIDFMVRRDRLKPVDPADIPKIRDILVWRRSGPLFVPLAVLAWAFVSGYSLTRVGFLALTTALVVFLLTGGPWSEIGVRLRQVVKAITAGGQAVVAIATLAAAAQIVVTIINMTGLAPKLSSLVVAASGGSVYLTLVMAMGMSLLLGMGMPTVAAYILAVTVVAGPLTALGIDRFYAHMFVFYFAVLSALTPPVCTSVYVASALAGTRDWMRTAILSVGIALSGFIVPFAFVLSPALMLRDSLPKILIVVPVTALGVIAVSAAVAGYMMRATPWWQRVILLTAGLMMIQPNWLTDVVGALLLLSIALYQMYLNRQEKAPTGAALIP